MDQPRNIVLLISDSLRYDSVHARGDHRLPYLSSHGVTFRQARSGGCWTLPATASMFSGLMPHQHGATSQTRAIRSDVPTLAERMKALGYSTHMVTANVATTHVFGLDRGFDTLDRVWKLTPAKHKKVHEVLVLVGKPRLRKQIWSKDFVMGKLSEDLDASKVWLQSTLDVVFDRTRELLEQGAAKGSRGFYFVNVMESHFPYHTSDTFETSAEGVIGRLREIWSLYHLVNMTWLTNDKNPIAPDMMSVLRRRQRLAWERIAPKIDDFARELREKYGAVVAFGSDHGDNFGEQGWQYHFSNVNDAGNRVPLFWLDPDGDDPRTIDTPVSGRDLYGTLLRRAGDPDPALTSLVHTPEVSVPVLQSYWYNNRGKTLDRYRYNQFGFVVGDQRYVHRQERWYQAPITRDDQPEPDFELLERGVDPLRESVVADAERRGYLRGAFGDYSAFSERLLNRRSDAA